MSLLTTSAASIHQLAAAAALAGSPTVPITQSSSLAEDGVRTVKNFWSVYDAGANTLLSAGWLIEQRTLRKRNLDRSTNMRVAIKDICVIGAMLSNIGNIVADQMFKREFPDGIPVTSSGAPTPDVSARAAAYCKYFKTAKLVNRLCVAGAIGFTPLVNFNVLKSYRPGTLYRLFT
jgi:hypothetical protein